MNFDRMRALLLDRAIRGELVPQLANECTTDWVGVAPEDVPFEIPRSWKWSYMKDICNALSDGSHNPPPNAGKGIPVLSAKNIFDSRVHVETASRWVTEEQWKLEDKKIHIERGDVLLTIVGTIGRTAVVGNFERFMLQRSVCVIKPKNESVDSHYLALMLTAPLMFQWLMDRAAGTAQKGVYLRTLKGMPLPIPPIEEQMSIVAKLEEAFTEIDRAEKAYEELQMLAGVLRGQILQKAMHGELVPQLEGEALPVGVKDVLEHSLDVPKSWKVTKLGDLISIKSGDGLSRKQYRSGAIPVYGGNGVNGYHDCSNVEKNTLVIGRVGYYCGNVQKTREPAWVTDNALIVTFKHDANVDFYLYILNAMKLGSKTSQTAQPVITGKILKPMLVPVPPLEEQARIVAKVEELLKHVDALSAR